MTMDIASRSTVDSMWRLQVEQNPDKDFLVFLDHLEGVDKTFSYAAFDYEVNRIAKVFASLGVQAGHHVGVQLPNSVEFLECLLGLARLGAVLVPLDHEDTCHEVLYVVEQCQIELLVRDSSCCLCEGLKDNAPKIISVGGDYERLKDECENLSIPAIKVTDSDLFQVMFTSGTESRPKGVMLTHANMVFSGFYVNWELQMVKDDRYFTSMSVNRVNFQLSALMPVLTAGATLILTRKFSASRMWKQVRETKATLVQSMAMIARTLLKQPVAPDEQQHNVRLVHHFLPLTDNEKQNFETRFKVGLVNNYGSSETLVGVITDIPLQPDNWPSIGKAGLGYQVKIVDDAGNEVPPETTGEILIQGVPGRTIMAGYWADPAATAERVTEDGWYYSHDFGYYDADGWIYFAGRRCDLIKRAGENVSASEIENVLMQHPAVAEAAVIGVPDPIRDEAVKAVVILKDGAHADEKDLIDFAASRLATFKVPSFIEIRDDLPRGPYGKVLKTQLRKEHIGRKDCYGN